MDKHTTPRLTRAYSPREIRDTQRFLFQVRLKRRLLYCLKIVNYLLLLAVGLLFVYPFAWMASMSLRPLIEALSFAPGLWVSDPQWSNYLYAWNQARIFHYVGNSIKYSVLVMGLQYFTLIPAAFAFATMKFRGKKLLWGAKFLGMMLPAEATFIPVYYFYSKLGLVDNWIGLIMPRRWWQCLASSCSRMRLRRFRRRCWRLRGWTRQRTAPSCSRSWFP